MTTNRCHKSLFQPFSYGSDTIKLVGRNSQFSEDANAFSIKFYPKYQLNVVFTRLAYWNLILKRKYAKIDIVPIKLAVKES